MQFRWFFESLTFFFYLVFVLWKGCEDTILFFSVWTLIACVSLSRSEMSYPAPEAFALLPCIWFATHRSPYPTLYITFASCFTVYPIPVFVIHIVQSLCWSRLIRSIRTSIDQEISVMGFNFSALLSYTNLFDLVPSIFLKNVSTRLEPGVQCSTSDFDVCVCFYFVVWWIFIVFNTSS